MYCSIPQVKDAGGVGTDAEITAAIAAAAARVDRFTGDVFEPVELTLQRPIDNDGHVRTGKRIISVTSVTYAGLETPIDPTGYRISNVEQSDRLSLVGLLAWADVTVNGAEPWNGGWAGLAGTYGRPEVVIVGEFGWSAVPLDVQLATAAIAAHIRGADQTPDPTGTDAANHVDDEGNVLPVVPPFTDDDAAAARDRAASVRARTTGVDEADALLAPFVREPVRFRA